MKMMKIVSGLAAVLLAAPAQAATLECTMKPGAAGGGYITEKFFFDYDEASGKAVAVDGLIQYYYDVPIPAKISDSTSKKVVFSWTVLMTNGTGQQTKMMYRAAVFKADNTITIRAVPGGGYSNSFEARGTCKKA